MQNKTSVPGTGTKGIPSVLTKALAEIFVAALGLDLVSGCASGAFFPHPTNAITAIKRIICLMALPCNPTSTHNQIILIKHTRLARSNGALGFVEMDSGAAVFAGLNSGHRAGVIVADARRDLDGLV